MGTPPAAERIRSAGPTLETGLSQGQSNRKRRSRGRGGQSSNNKAAEHQARIDLDAVEDPQTFWARSNARLGVDPAMDVPSGKRGRSPVEFPCAVCGIWVMLERWPKDRHEVRCDACRAAVGDLLTGDERSIASSYRDANGNGRARLEGLPQMSPEDLEAIAEMRALANAMGNGRSSNRKRGGGGGGGGGKRKRKRAGSSSSRRGGGGGGHGGRKVADVDGNSAGGDRKRRRRRKSRRREGGEGDAPQSSGGAEAAAD